jgi:hypothetical protein
VIKTTHKRKSAERSGIEVLKMYDRASFNQVNNRTNRCNNN